MSQKNGVVVSKAAKVEAANRNAVVKAGAKKLAAIVKAHDAGNGKGNGKANSNGKPVNGKPAAGKAPVAAKPPVKDRAKVEYTTVGETKLLTRSVATLRKIGKLATGKDGVWVKALHEAMHKDGATSQTVGAATYHLCGKGLVGWMHRDVEDADKRWAYSFFLTAEGKKVIAELK
jgi:hypothetical protein